MHNDYGCLCWRKLLLLLLRHCLLPWYVQWHVQSQLLAQGHLKR